MKEKTADEMFEELGYKKVRDDERFIKYRKPYDNDYIVMDKETKDFIKNFDFAYWKAVNMQELQAINKKVEELRMARVKKIIQTIKLHKFKTEVNKKIIEEMDESSYLVWYRDGTCKEVNFKDDLIDILSKDHIKPIRYIFNMSDRIIVDRKIYINTEEVF